MTPATSAAACRAVLSDDEARRMRAANELRRELERARAEGRDVARVLTEAIVRFTVERVYPSRTRSDG